MDSKRRIDVRLRIDFGPSSALGPGKIALLEEIALGGSLAQAAKELGMSYRRAWGLLQDLGQAFGEPVAITTRRRARRAAARSSRRSPTGSSRPIARSNAPPRPPRPQEFAGVVRQRSSRKRAVLRRTLKKTRRGNRPATKRR